MWQVTMARALTHTLVRRTVLTAAWQVAGICVVAAALLAFFAMAGPGVLALGLLVASLALAWGWAGMAALPSPRGTCTVLIVGAVLATLAVAADTRLDVPWLPGALAGGVLGAFLHQLLRVDGRPRLVESVTGVCLGLVVVASGALLVPVLRVEPSLVVATLAAGAAAACIGVLGRWEAVQPWLVPGAMLAGGAAAVLVAPWSLVSWPVLLLVGVVTGVIGHAARSVLSVLPTLAHLRPRLVSALASMLITGVVPYAVAQLLSN